MAAPAGPTRAERLTPDAFAEAFTSRARVLWCIAAGVLGGRENVEDVLQEGALIALGKLDQFDPETSFVAWMGQIVRFVALNHARRRQRSRTSLVDAAVLDSVVAAAPVPDHAPTSGRGSVPITQACFDDEVMSALGSLEETARSCLLLRSLLEMPYREIGLALDVPEGTAMSHVHRARRAMRERLRSRDPRTAPGTDDEDGSR